MRLTCAMPFNVVVIVAVLASVKSIVMVSAKFEVNSDGSYTAPSQSEEACEKRVPDHTVPFQLPPCAVKNVALPLES